MTTTDDRLAAYLDSFDGDPGPPDPEGEDHISNATPGGEVLYRDRVDAELEMLRVRDEARRLFTAEQHSAKEPLPEAVALDEFLSQPDLDAVYRIEGLLPTGGRALLAAQYKAGKTTLVGNLLRSLADGTAFLGRFDTVAASVALIDDEVDERQLRRQLRDQNIVNPAAVKVFSLRGRVSSFDILDTEVRTLWADRLRGADILVLDCLRPVLDALGLDENREAGRLLVAFDELLREAGISEAVVVHHMGHSGERSRGDSRLLDWPDVLWKIVRDSTEDNPAADRYFSAFGRDVDIREGKLDYTHADRSLLFVDTNRTEAAGHAMLPAITEILSTEREGLSGRQLEDALKARGHPQKAARQAMKIAQRDGLTYTVEGSRNARIHHLNPSSASVRQSASPVRQRGESECVSASIETHSHSLLTEEGSVRCDALDVLPTEPAQPEEENNP